MRVPTARLASPSASTDYFHASNHPTHTAIFLSLSLSAVDPVCTRTYIHTYIHTHLVASPLKASSPSKSQRPVSYPNPHPLPPSRHAMPCNAALLPSSSSSSRRGKPLAFQPEPGSGRLLRGSVMAMTTTTTSSFELQVYQAASQPQLSTYIHTAQDIVPLSYCCCCAAT
ncbi:hypothetical protein BKA81DRAFT_200555 [Phyllosticta paracitricarpa]